MIKIKVIEIQELLNSLEITLEDLDVLLKNNLISRPLSETETEILYPANVVDEIKHVLGLRELGYSLDDTIKILKITDQTKAKKPPKTRYFTVGQVATQLDITKRTLDYWIEKGLIKPSSTSKSGYRLFNEDAVKIITFVGNLQTIGFTLEQIRTITENLDEGFLPVDRDIDFSIESIQNKINDNEKAIKSLRSTLKTIQKNMRGLKNLERGDTKD